MAPHCAHWEIDHENVKEEISSEHQDTSRRSLAFIEEQLGSLVRKYDFITY